jgi:hypothetical protein
MKKLHDSQMASHTGAGDVFGWIDGWYPILSCLHVMANTLDVPTDDALMLCALAEMYPVS